MTDSASKSLTPAMRQFMEAKKEAPEDAVLLFRMGDFYELFFEDARIGAPLMDVALTQRNGVPMCGVPYHSAQVYIAKLLEHGRKVAVAEQVEDPKQAKGLVRREITRVITPGTVLDEDQMLNARRGNFLVAVCPDKDASRFGVALLEVSVGDFRVCQAADRTSLETELSRLQPSEVLIPSSLYEKWRQNDSFPEAGDKLLWSPLDNWLFDVEIARDNLCRHFEVTSLDGFGCRDQELAVAAGGAIFSYTRNNLRREADHITTMRHYETGDSMVLDRVSQRNLELVEPLFSNAADATLRSVLDQTRTPMGGRMLREWILRPLYNRQAIEERLDAVQALVQEPLLQNELAESFQSVRDLERTLTRLNVGGGSARELAVLRRGLEAVPGLRALLAECSPSKLRQLSESMSEQPELTAEIRRAVVDEPPATITDGNMLRQGYSEKLDELRQAAAEGKDWIAAMQAREQERTGIKSLKVRYNKVFGYFIEITKSNLSLVPDDYMRKQTLTNAERFITPELKELEDKVLGAEEKSKALEYELFLELRQQATAATESIQRTARAIAELDSLNSLAEVAAHHQYCRPELCEEPIIDIRDGRHPVLEQRMQDEGFVPNDTCLDAGDYQLAVITGPNMAGKSTYIRQVALLTLMAQMGSFVPAKSARIGLVDRIFTRIGAADDISRGQSTFMVEMVETANILNNASPRSLIILDEVGRGTSTFDGLSLAWAIAEHLHDQEANKARTLFATHYHELTELALTRSGVKNYNVAVREWGEQIIFLRKILPGGTDKSYGIHVARLAGLPKTVISRAKEVLSNLEGNAVTDQGKPTLAREHHKKGRKKKDPPPPQPSLFEWSSRYADE